MPRIQLAPALLGDRLLVAGWTLLLALLVIVAVSRTIAPPNSDAAIFLHVGEGILRGDLPYADRWDNKGPLLFVLNAAGMGIHETWGIWVVQGVFLLATATFALLTLRGWLGLTPALFASAIFLALYSRFSGSGNFTEQYNLLFQFAALYLFLAGERQSAGAANQSPSRILFMGIGVLGAASFLLRPNLIVFWAAIGLYWLLRRGSDLRKLAWTVIGGGGVLVLAAGYFLAVGAWEALWDAYFVFNFAQSNPSHVERIDAVRSLAEEAPPITLLVSAAWFTGVSLLARKSVRARPRTGLLDVAVLALPFEVASLSLSGFGYAHYFLVILPASALLLAFGAWLVLEHAASARLLIAALMLLGAVFNTVPHSNVTYLYEKYTRDPIVDEPLEARVARHVSAWTEPDDPILVWGNGALIYLRSGRYAPTRYFYHHPLVKPNYTTQAMRDEFFTDVFTAKPKLIIDSHYQWFSPLDREERVGWQPHSRYWHDPQDF